MRINNNSSINAVTIQHVVDHRIIIENRIDRDKNVDADRRQRVHQRHRYRHRRLLPLLLHSRRRLPIRLTVIGKRTIIMRRRRLRKFTFYHD